MYCRTTYNDASAWLVNENLFYVRKLNDKQNIPTNSCASGWSVAYSSQGSHTGPLDFCNWLADNSTTDNVISIYSIKSINVDFLIRSATSQSSTYPDILTRLGRPRPRPNPHLKSWKSRNWTRDLMVSSQTCWPLDEWGSRFWMIMLLIISYLDFVSCISEIVTSSRTRSC